MKRLFRYFELSLAEQRGFIALILVILCSASIPYIYDTMRKEEALGHHLTVFENRSSDIQKYANSDNNEKEQVSKEKVVLEEFNPNGLSIREWNRLGLSVKQAGVIKNYEAKGGRFRKKEDLARMYSISDVDYERLAPYIKIEVEPGGDVEKQRSHTTLKKTIDETKRREGELRDERLMIDIMKADSATLVALRGIGPVLAHRIVKYREALGGFSDINQITEVYGLPVETYDTIKDKLYLPDPVVKKISVNKVTIEELAKHPYVSRKQAQWIVNYRQQHGFYNNMKSLAGITLLNQDFLRKIEPYLQF